MKTAAKKTSLLPDQSEAQSSGSPVKNVSPRDFWLLVRFVLYHFSIPDTCRITVLTRPLPIYETREKEEWVVLRAPYLCLLNYICSSLQNTFNTLKTIDVCLIYQRLLSRRHLPQIWMRSRLNRTFWREGRGSQFWILRNRTFSYIYHRGRVKESYVKNL